MSFLSRVAVAAVVALLVLRPAAVPADAYDPSPTYYSTATGTGATLKNQLHDIIDGHTVRSYDAARQLLQDTDQDLTNPNLMVLVYNRVKLNVTTIGGGTGWDNGASWNREHVWPQARGVGSSGPDSSDLHMLRPSNPQLNNDRGNLNFGGAYGQSYGVKTDGGNQVWYPGDADAGMIARQSFYMAVRYDGSDGSTTNLELVNGAPALTGSSTTMGDLARMLEWHYLVPPDEFERRRNQTVFGYQNNRNPFVDRPEYAWSVFANQNNDSQLALAGATLGSNGGSTLAVDLGRVLVGAPTPAAQTVTLNKTGAAGTYFEVVASGAATSSVTGRYNAFATGGAGSRSISVGLSTSTATAGLKSGTVVVDNLDVTTGSGLGRGSQDANDVVQISLAVLDHAKPSFQGLAQTTALSYDFGSIITGGPAPTFSFDIFNLASTAGYTAALELNQIFGSGDTAALTINAAPFTGAAALAAGEHRSFLAALNPAAVGDFAVTYTFSFSDENLPGAVNLGTMQLMLTGSVVAAADSADFTDDGFVDGVDFLVWQRHAGTLAGATRAQGDANGDGSVTADDLAVWQSQFGDSPDSLVHAAAVPEPATLSLAALSLFLAPFAARRRRRVRRPAVVRLSVAVLGFRN
ncbi:MAG: endonuclease [Pirellulales bacterium]|nr:endonuclease [Pirellulales bacterium]